LDLALSLSFVQSHLKLIDAVQYEHHPMQCRAPLQGPVLAGVWKAAVESEISAV